MIKMIHQFYVERGEDISNRERTLSKEAMEDLSKKMLGAVLVTMLHSIDSGVHPTAVNVELTVVAGKKGEVPK